MLCTSIKRVLISYALETTGFQLISSVQDVQDYVEVKCPEGVPKNALCVDVTAGISYTNKKPAYNSEVFGRVRYQNGESALYGDFAEASDGMYLTCLYSFARWINPKILLVVSVPVFGSDAQLVSRSSTEL